VGEMACWNELVRMGFSRCGLSFGAVVMLRGGRAGGGGGELEGWVGLGEC